MKSLCSAVLIFLSFTISSAQTPPKWSPEFEKYIDELIAQYHVPGIAIQVVNDKGVVYTLTRGYRNVQEKLPVTPQTVFAIGSTTKAFTAAVLAQLKDQGKIDFDIPVEKYRADFSIKDKIASHSLTLRDLMGHWTGVARSDLAWVHRPGLTRDKMYHLIPKLDMEAPPRTKFIYNNYMWVAAGVIAETQSGQSWETLIQKNIFDPLEMQHSSTSLAEVLVDGDHSLPYASDESQSIALPFNDIQAANPAGGIYSNVEDMGHWLNMLLGHGIYQNKIVVSEASLAENFKPYSIMDGGSFKYAMGWALLPFGDATLYTHDGGIDGFTSNVSLMPDKNLGLVVLTTSSEVVPQTVAFRLWQHLLGQPLKDWTRESVKKMSEAQAKAKLYFPDATLISDPQPLNILGGRYCNDAYGAADVEATSSGLHIVMNAITLNVAAYGPLKFVANGVFQPLKYVTFLPEGQGFDWAVDTGLSKPIRFTKSRSDSQDCESSQPHTGMPQQTQEGQSQFH